MTENSSNVSIALFWLFALFSDIFCIIFERYMFKLAFKPKIATNDRVIDLLEAMKVKKL